MGECSICLYVVAAVSRSHDFFVFSFRRRVACEKNENNTAVRAGSPERPRGVDEAGEADGGVPPRSHAEQNRHRSGEVRLRRRGERCKEDETSKKKNIERTLQEQERTV